MYRRPRCSSRLTWRQRSRMLLHHTPERTRGSPHRRDPGAEGYGVRHNYRRDWYPHTGCQGPGGPQHSHAGGEQGPSGISQPGEPTGRHCAGPESLLNERYQLERRMMIHGTAWRKKTLLKDIALNEIAITRKDRQRCFATASMSMTSISMNTRQTSW